MMKKYLYKLIVSLSAIAFVTGTYGLVELPSLAKKTGLALFSHGDRCSTIICGLDSEAFSVPAPAYADIQSEVEEALICQCGCGIVLKHCPHQNCGFAIPAREYIADLVKEGKKRDEIIEIFVKQHGQKALATPKKEGFNLLGYILPFFALIAAAFFLSRVIKTWTSRGMREEEKVLMHLPEDTGSELDKKIEEELKKLD